MRNYAIIHNNNNHLKPANKVIVCGLNFFIFNFHFPHSTFKIPLSTLQFPISIFIRKVLTFHLNSYIIQLFGLRREEPQMLCPQRESVWCKLSTEPAAAASEPLCDEYSVFSALKKESGVYDVYSHLYINRVVPR